MQRRTLLGALAALPAAAGAGAFRDLLDTPATKSALAARGLVNGLASAGTRLVAVGQRGHVLTSDDAGASWLQADEVPVSSDLVAVQFPTPQRGWAVGHDGVVLHSSDGGRRWTRQFDGRRLGPRGAENPLFDLWFDDERQGWAVGAFGTLLRTVDGGASWTAMPEAADNPKSLHLYAIRRVGTDLLIAGEQGLLLKHDGLKHDGQRFSALALPYPGTLFGVLGHERVLVAHGLRGTVLRSIDGGRNWALVPTGVGVGLTAGTVDGQGRLLLVSQAGHVLLSRDDGASFTPLKTDRPLPAAAVAVAGRTLVVGGPRGLHAQAI